MRILAVTFLAALGLPAFCQNAHGITDRQIPEYVVYDAFFYRVNWLEDQASKVASQGKDATLWRSMIRNQAGLTAREEEVLKGIAAIWRQQNANLLTAARAAVTAGQTSESPQVKALQAQRIQTVNDRLAELRAAFGAARFSVLDTFVRRPTAANVPADRMSKARSGRK